MKANGIGSAAVNADTKTLKLSFKERLGYAITILSGQQELVEINIPFRIAHSTTYTTGGYGSGPIDASFGQRGHGGREVGAECEARIIALQNDSPLEFSISPNRKAVQP